MNKFIFICRAIDVVHLCSKNKSKSEEPNHSSELLECIDNVIKLTQGLEFPCSIESAANRYAIDSSDFDSKWIEKMVEAGWKKTEPDIKSLKDIPDIQPDAFLKYKDRTVVIEIEKSKKERIWFDFIKFMMLIKQNLADFGILITPTNYPHRNGTINLFFEARNYRNHLVKFAGVDENLFSKIAIIGYTQGAYISENMLELDNTTRLEKLDKEVIKYIKDSAKDFLKSPEL